MNMTTAQLETAALAVPCPEHHVTADTVCPRRPGGAFGRACMTRRELADARHRVAAFPPKEELERLEHDDVIRVALRLCEAAEDLSRCVDAALSVDAPRPVPAWHLAATDDQQDPSAPAG